MVESGHASSAGVSQGKVTAILKFLRNRWIPHDKMPEFEKHHRLDDEEYAIIRKRWKSDKGGCNAWEVELEQVLDCPFFIPLSSGDPNKAHIQQAGPLHNYDTHIF